MAVALVASTATSSNGTSGGSTANPITVAKPAGVTDGDWLLCYIVANGTGDTWTPPSGWTTVLSENSFGIAGVFVKHIPTASAETATSYQWTIASPERFAAVLMRVTGADATTFTDATSAVASGSGANLTLNAATAVSNSGFAVAFCLSASATTSPITFTPASGWTEDYEGNTPTSEAVIDIEIAHKQLTSSGSTGTPTFTATSAGNGLLGWVVVVKPAPAASASVTSVRCGGVTTSGFSANLDSMNCTTARLAVSTSAAMTSPTYFGPGTPDTDGCLTLAATGLSASTQYWWQFECNGTLAGPIGKARTLPAGVVAGRYSFIATSCSDTDSNADVFTEALSRTNPSSGIKALFAVHLGDLHYADISTNHPGAQSLALNLTAWRRQFVQPKPAQLYREIPTEFTMSDHDFGQDQAVGSDGNATYYYQAWRKLGSASYPCVPDTTPDPTISGQQGIYRTWTLGQVTYILTDGRGYMDDTGKTDNASKTKLGATQKAWLKATALAAVQAGRVVVWFHEDGWHNDTTFTNDDTWAAYTTERNEIATYFTANGITSKLIYIHGDWHELAADDGTNNPWGGWPLVCASPWEQGAGVTGHPHGWTQGMYPASGSATTKSYGWFDVIDDTPGQVTINFTGYNDDADTGTETSKITLSRTFVLAAPASATGTVALTGTANPGSHAAATATLTLTGTSAPKATAAATGTVNLAGTGGTTASQPASGLATVTLTGLAAAATQAAASALLALTGTDNSGTLTASAAGTLQLSGTGAQPYTGAVILATADPANMPPRVRLSLTGFTGATTVTVYRVDSSGNQTVVRAFNQRALTAGAAVDYDYDAPFLGQVTYLAIPSTGAQVTSDPVTLLVYEPWLYHATIPSLSCPLSEVSRGDRTHATSRALQYAIGRPTAVPTSDGTRRAATYDLTIRTYDLTTEAAIDALLADSSVLLLQVALDGQTRTLYQWIDVGDVAEADLIGGFTDDPYLQWTFPVAVTDPPAGLIQAQRTYADAYAEFATYDLAAAAFANYRDAVTDTLVGT